jgi:hypothetical protein
VRTNQIDGAICAWANEGSAEEAMMSLQAARLDPGAVRRPADLLGHPHLLALGPSLQKIAALNDAEIIGTMLCIAEDKQLQRTSA